MSLCVFECKHLNQPKTATDLPGRVRLCCIKSKGAVAKKNYQKARNKLPFGKKIVYAIFTGAESLCCIPLAPSSNLGA